MEVIDRNLVRGIVVGFLAGGILATVMIVVVLALGLTFGQRCAEFFEPESTAWFHCIDRLRDGGNI